MDRGPDVRREVGLELQRLADEFASGDEAAFRRNRIACWTVTALAGTVVLLLLLLGGDWRYLVAFWLVGSALAWGVYGLSARRQRIQTDKLRALASRWLA